MTTSPGNLPASVPETSPDSSHDTPWKFPERIPAATRQAICIALGQGQTQIVVAQQFGVSLSSVGRIVRDTKKGFVWRGGGFDEIRALYRARPDFETAVRDLAKVGATIHKGSAEWETLKEKYREFLNPPMRRVQECLMELGPVEVKEGELTPQQEALYEFLDF
jgi:hypothetical protein